MRKLSERESPNHVASYDSVFFKAYNDNWTQGVQQLLGWQATASPLAAPPVGMTKQAEESGKFHLGVIIAVCVIAFLASKVIFFGLWYLQRSRRQKICEIRVSGGTMVLFKTSGKVTPSTKAMLRKTEDLSSKDIIGSGGYGTVYRLLVDDQTAYAVKKLTRGGTERERGFERELEALSDIKHRNLVALRGYYSSPHINLLIYDLMPNGSLENALHDRSSEEEALDWPTRYNIALGAARGIAYLHQDCIPHIIHRDIKSSNILLDANMEARVSDFGLAKLISPGQTHATTIVAGTLGYLAPEYVDTGRATEKGDVYSFGVVLLELVTGKRPTAEMFIEKGINLIAWVRTLVETDQVQDIFDKDLADTCSDRELKDMLDISGHCLDPDPRHRPTMTQVVKMLENLDPGLDW